MTKRGYQLPELDYQAAPEDPQGRLDIEAATPVHLSDTPPHDTEQSQTPNFEVPEQARPAVNIVVEDADSEWDRLDKQGIRTGEQTRRDVGGAALTAEDIEKAEIEEVRKRLARTKAKPASSVHKKRSFRAKFSDTTDYVTRQLKDI